MNFLKKYAILLAGLAYLVMGLGWVVYVFNFDAQAVFPEWSFTNLFFIIYMMAAWPGFIGLFLTSHAPKFTIIGAIGLIILILILTPCLLFFIRGIRKRFMKKIS